jgi:S-adenosylmethionine-diacylglycerol 3-amino-3-carboxypropyl transferase
MGSEVQAKADFTGIRYAQCWEDADILVDALDIQPGDVCLSIASAGDNAIALLTRHPSRVIALDLSPAQLACVEVRVAAYRTLEHAELLEFMGSVPSRRRRELYLRCRPLLGESARTFWDSKPKELAAGIGGAGKFERYFGLFRRYVLPLVHRQPAIKTLLRGGTRQERYAYYRRHWDTLAWRLLFRVFFSRFVMGRMGRDPSFFDYVEGSVAERILARAKHAVTALNPAENPYLHWIMTGGHSRESRVESREPKMALPLALREEHFQTIRANMDRLQWRCQSVEEFLASQPPRSVDRFNLSDIFEYMSEPNYHRLLDQIVAGAKPGGRLAYWNMLAPRSRPESFANKLRPLNELADRLHLQDKAFFYSRFVVEEVLA